MLGEAHLDVKAALGAGLRGQGGAMRAGRPPSWRSRPGRRARCAAARFPPGWPPGSRPGSGRRWPEPRRARLRREPRGARLPRHGPRSPSRPARPGRRNPAVNATLAASQGEQRLDQAFLLLGPGPAVPRRSPGASARPRPGRPAPPGSASAPRRAGCAVRGRRWPRTAAATRTTPPAGRNRSSRVAPRSVNSSSRPPRPSRRCRLLAEMSRAVAVIVRSGRRNRPATSQPSATEIVTRPTTVAAARMTCPRESAWIWAMVAGLAPCGIDCLMVRTGTRSTATPQTKKNPRRAG